MGEIRSNPSILGAGVWTYSKEQNLPGTEDWCNDQTLEKYVSSHVAQDCADGLNLLIRNYNAGVQITYKLYSEQEIAEDSSRNNVEFYYYPASTPDAKYALVLSGNIFNRTAELKECISTAYQLHQKGYAVFVMRYRAYPDNDTNGGGHCPGGEVHHRPRTAVRRADGKLRPDRLFFRRTSGGPVCIGRSGL